MLLLALDTSTSAVTVALHDGHSRLAETTRVDSRAHGELLAPGLVQTMGTAGIRPEQLTDIVCGLGPGPFTGLRVGIVTARMLALVTGARLHGVCSLDAVAYDAAGGLPPGTELLVATDARRKEVYWARYAVGEPGAARVTTITAPAVNRPGDLPDDVRELPTAGRGPHVYADLFPNPVPPLDVSAAALAELTAYRLAAGEPMPPGEPLYLRRPDAAPNVAAKSALG